MLFTNRLAARTANKSAKQLLLPISLAACTSISLAMPMAASAQDNISKLLLVKMARENAGVLCKSDVFTACMGFTAMRCDELKEEAITTCLDPLPDSINLDELQNDALEACPQKVYAEAGFPEEKAEMCFDEAINAEPAPAGAVEPAQTTESEEKPTTEPTAAPTAPSELDEPTTDLK